MLDSRVDKVSSRLILFASGDDNSPSRLVWCWCSFQLVAGSATRQALPSESSSKSIATGYV